MNERVFTIDDVIEYFGTRHNLAKVLGVTNAAISIWKRRGGIPQLQAMRLEKITRGRLPEEKIKRPMRGSCNG